jgi:hypothetical protein
VPDYAGGEGLSPSAAWAGVNRGTATTAIENIARVNHLTANLLMHFSRFALGRFHTEALLLEQPRPRNIPGQRCFLNDPGVAGVPRITSRT